MVSALRFQSGKLYSGGKDGKINVINQNSLKIESTISVGSMIKAIDVCGSTFICFLIFLDILVAGLKNGNIIKHDLDTED